jgi:hypothetical protein
VGVTFLPYLANSMIIGMSASTDRLDNITSVSVEVASTSPHKVCHIACRLKKHMEPTGRH